MKQSSILSAKFDCPVARQNLSLLATGLLNGMRSRWRGWVWGCGLEWSGVEWGGVGWGGGAIKTQACGNR